MVKLVALVVGASRGIGRQVAIDLAKNDYRGRSCARLLIGYKNTLTAQISGCLGENYVQRLQCWLCFPTRSKFSVLHNQHRGTGNS